MSTYFGITSDSASTLFGSLSSSSSSTSTTSLLSDYASIKNGSYAKLLKKYYATNSADSTSSTSTSADTTKKLASIESNAEDLKEAADALLTKGSNSVFKKVTTTDESGNSTTDYDTDKIYNAVSKFVESYNNMIDSTDDSNTKNIQNNATSMMNATAKNAALLGKIGITIKSDNTLSVDEDTFKAADMTTVQSLFNGAGSYGYNVSAKASMIDYYAATEANKSNTYNQTGSYSNNYSTGSNYSSWF